MKDDPLGMEHAAVDIGDDGLVATSTAFGTCPIVYRLDLDLRVGADWVTCRLALTASGDGWSRSLVLEREATWSVVATSTGVVPPSVIVSSADDAVDASRDPPVVLDVDVQYSPLTNVMPIRRAWSRSGRRDRVVRDGLGERAVADRQPRPAALHAAGPRRRRAVCPLRERRRSLHGASSAATPTGWSSTIRGSLDASVESPPPSASAHCLTAVGRRPAVDDKLPVLGRDDRDRVDVDREEDPNPLAARSHGRTSTKRANEPRELSGVGGQHGCPGDSGRCRPPTSAAPSRSRPASLPRYAVHCDPWIETQILALPGLRHRPDPELAVVEVRIGAAQPWRAITPDRPEHCIGRRRQDRAARSARSGSTF